MTRINKWWSGLPGERFWLGVVRRENGCDVLASPCDGLYEIPAWRNGLITGVRDGDAVFHFDAERGEIVAWSTARGRALEHALDWDRPSHGPALQPSALRSLPTWTVKLSSSTPLESCVALDGIAHAQWEIFGELRALEDRVGDPLYYPFVMGRPDRTQLLNGHVFKLPAVFVNRFPSMARVAQQLAWSSERGPEGKANGRTRAPAHARSSQGAPQPAVAVAMSREPGPGGR